MVRARKYIPSHLVKPDPSLPLISPVVIALGTTTGWRMAPTASKDSKFEGVKRIMAIQVADTR